MNIDMMDSRLACRIRIWAKFKYAWLTEREYGHDWWHAYNDDWDINIYTNEDDEVVVTAYPMFRGDDGYLETDHSYWCDLGAIATINKRKGK